GKDAQVYLGSAELSAVCAALGKIPTLDEYLAISNQKLSKDLDSIYQYLNFDQMPEYKPKKVIEITEI
ncbi:MAG: bifunctional aconitate hydratase 2 and 2-methylisocitrate dehydratase, partial [Pseudomonadota bacterium]